LNFNSESNLSQRAPKLSNQYLLNSMLSNDFFSYQAGVVFRPTEHGSIYASYATAANPVGMDADIPAGVVVLPLM
jgi:outer membrane receptor for monomeric catechols